jgi:amino acid permease
MDSQTKVFRAHRALAWFYALIGVGVTAAVVLGSSRGFEPGMLIMFLVFGCIFAVHYLTARACKAGKEGGRIASIVISCLMLLGFPIGTLIGIYLLSNTWRSWSTSNGQLAR